MVLEKQFVYFMWDDVLEGKEVFVGDSMAHLHDAIDNNKMRTRVRWTDGEEYPFEDTEHAHAPYRFVYYDPHYDLKRAYYVDGRRIQYLNSDGKWEDIQQEPSWKLNPRDYRPKPDNDTRVTYRTLAKWLAQGKGEYMFIDGDNICVQSLTYNEGMENKEVGFDIVVRKWSDTEWHDPTEEYLADE